ncbi:ester cyclase [Streptomyces sp. NBC_01275]|uniref:ester cyclase n=1 Tax=Streptomyces sp. NBC_01275 TaxID=2903807 RepID=UPI00224E3D51|nr:ester cyclase [Streptomyces sp. NBC_01275]MCX4766944.1 ester cyclase [Streptomyces sp. NBC_01275]
MVLPFASDTTTQTESQRQMSPESVESVMKRFVEFINTADEDLAREVIDPDAVFHAPSHAEPLRGPEGYLEIIAMMRSAFPDVRWTLEESIAEGSTVAARFTMRGTHEGEFFGIPATGKKIAVQAMNFYYLADGRIVKERGQPDLLGLMQQIGAVPAP